MRMTTTTGNRSLDTLADYLLVTATEMPPVELAHHESPTPFNPLGIKGVGEGGALPIAPPVVGGRGCTDAVRRAPSRTPIMPSEIVAIVHAQQRRRRNGRALR